jgi:hypothetical protein
MVWVPIAAWGAAVLVALVVLGFFGYEIAWKTARLRRDVHELQDVADELAELRSSIAAVQERAAAVSPR